MVSDMSVHPIRLAIANDFELVVVGLARMLEPFGDRVRVVDLSVGGDAISVPVDVALFDVFGRTDGGAAELVPLVDSPNVRHVAVFTWQLDPNTVARGFALGASGYLSKNLTARELVEALERIVGGERVVAGHGPADYSFDPDLDWPGHALGLTERESEILILIAEGRTNAEIASALHLSLNSIKTHIRSAYRKLSIERRPQAVRMVLDLGLAKRSTSGDSWDALRRADGLSAETRARAFSTRPEG